LIGVPALMLVDGALPDDVDGAFKRVMLSPAWSRPAVHTTRACWHRAWVDRGSGSGVTC